MKDINILIYFLRRDLRVSDNPIFHHLASTPEHGFTHLLPVYVFPAHQMEVSGFLEVGSVSPYPEARSQLRGYWRCGPHRAKFIAESVWNLKESLDSLESGLVIRVGRLGEVARTLVEGLQERQLGVGAVWMTSDVGPEERLDEHAVSSVCDEYHVVFKLWFDEKYFIDDRDLKFTSPQVSPDAPVDYENLPCVFTDYRRSVEPLRTRPRKSLPKPSKSTLPGFLDASEIPPQSPPFSVPDTFEELELALVQPVKHYLPDIPSFPPDAVSAHPFRGGEDPAQDRLKYLVQSLHMRNYHETRDGLVGPDFSTKLSGFLAQGNLTARQVHEALSGYEDGTDDAFKDVPGFGQGYNQGTEHVRCELLWRDFMRLVHNKFGNTMFHREGIAAHKGDAKRIQWRSAAPVKSQNQQSCPIQQILDRFNNGTTGMGFVDASQRELMHTGYTSNRARQVVASFFAKHLFIDWRYGAEWYEMLLVDYDVSSNWGNWQYLAGVGVDPRSEGRIFNPVKQAFDYDKEGTFVRSWLPEVSRLEKLENVFQVWTTNEHDARETGLDTSVMFTNPIKKIEFTANGPKSRSHSSNQTRCNQSSQQDEKGHGNRHTGSQATGSASLHVGGNGQANGSLHNGLGHSRASGNRRGASRGTGGWNGGGSESFRGNHAHHPNVRGSHAYHFNVPGNHAYRPNVPGNHAYHPNVPGIHAYHPNVPGNLVYHPNLRGNHARQPNFHGGYVYHPSLNRGGGIFRGQAFHPRGGIRHGNPQLTSALSAQASNLVIPAQAVEPSKVQ